MLLELCFVVMQTSLCGCHIMLSLLQQSYACPEVEWSMDLGPGL